MVGVGKCLLSLRECLTQRQTVLFEAGQLGTRSPTAQPAKGHTTRSKHRDCGGINTTWTRVSHSCTLPQVLHSPSLQSLSASTLSQHPYPETMASKTENVMVVVRCRPFNDKEKAAGHKKVVETQPSGVVSLKSPKDDNDIKTYTFDAAFDEDCKQV